MGGNPKPVALQTDISEWAKLVQGTFNDAKHFTDAEILENLKRASVLMKNDTGTDYWTTDDGQAELLRRIQLEPKPPSTSDSAPRSRGKCGTSAAGLSPLDYTQASKSIMERGSLSAVGNEEEWIEAKLMADSGACDTVIPRKTVEAIPIMPSLASLRGMEYEVANGQSIPNLGERRCLVWTENATEVKRMVMQVADVHKGLLSLSRCADMGYKGRFGRYAGALICETSGEVIPLVRKGNLYVLCVWIKAAPLGRQETP